MSISIPRERRCHKRNELYALYGCNKARNKWNESFRAILRRIVENRNQSRPRYKAKAKAKARETRSRTTLRHLNSKAKSRKKWHWGQGQGLTSLLWRWILVSVISATTNVCSQITREKLSSSMRQTTNKCVDRGIYYNIVTIINISSMWTLQHLRW